MPSRAVAHAGLIVTGILALVSGTQGQADVPLERLTVPADRLGTVCRLIPSDSVFQGNQFRGGLWRGLPISSNPWRGADRKTTSSIRERITASPELPDGPPLSASELARFQSQLVEDVEEAYAAVYGDDGTAGVIVYGIRFSKLPVPDLARGTYLLRTLRGRTVIAVTGSAGPCADAVGAYIKDLPR